MNTRRNYNRRWIGWLLMLALFATSLPSQAAWLCPTGTLCAADCPMLRGDAVSANGVVLSARRSQTLGAAHCSHCPAAAAVSSLRPSRGVTQTLRAPIKCVLRAHSQPLATLAGAFVILLPLLALPPPPAPTRYAVVLEEPSSVVHSLPVFLLPPCPARPHPGRAPPFRLA